MTRHAQTKNHRGFFGIGIDSPKREVNVGTLFRSAYSFGASFVFTIKARYHEQTSDTTKSHRHLPLLYFVTIEDLIEHLPHGCQLIGVELSDDAITLPKFQHPQQACYLLGAEDNGLSKLSLAHCHKVVQIPGGEFCLNVSCAGTIVLYDRIAKGLKEK